MRTRRAERDGERRAASGCTERIAPRRGLAGVEVARQWLWTSADRPPGHHVSRGGPAPRAPGSPPVGHLRGARSARTPLSNRPSRAMRHGAAPEGGPPAAVGAVLPSIPSAACRAERSRRPGPRADAPETRRRLRRCQPAQGVTRSADEARAFRSPSGVVGGGPAIVSARRSDGAVPARVKWRPGRTPRGGGRRRSALPVASAVWSAASRRATGHPRSVRHRVVKAARGGTPRRPGSTSD